MRESAPLFSIHRLVWMALMAALTAVGGMIAIPVGPLSPVPITLQTMFVLLAGLILGPRGGAFAMLLYMAAGALGLPVFAGGKAGLAVFLGPTGGFLVGFLPSAIICGFAKRIPPRSYPAILLYCALATAVTLAIGTVQLAAVLQVSMTKALAVGVVPFLPGGVLKCLGAAFIYRFLTVRGLL
ncbi:MAG: biotin transporter BioY, partial [Deltaproteobacteria bacterium]|nr:biotin transporter BioY [Deltaproteobacteria bacterium]